MNRTRTAATLTLAALVLTGCSTISTNPDQAGLHYAAGPLSDTKFDNCVETGTRAWDGPSDKHYVYPAGQRTFAFGEGDGQDSAPFTIAAGNVELVVSGVTRFALNTDCDTLKAFHEQIGAKFGISSDGGDYNAAEWTRMLGTYVYQPLQRAIGDATQGVDWVALYNDPGAKAAWEKRINELLPVYVKQTSGGDYFKDFSITLQKPGLPDDLRNALQAQETAIRNQATQIESNKTLELERQGIASMVALLGPEGYNTYTALKNGKITFMALPQGSSVIAPAPVAAP